MVEGYRRTATAPLGEAVAGASADRHDRRNVPGTRSSRCRGRQPARQTCPFSSRGWEAHCRRSRGSCSSQYIQGVSTRSVDELVKAMGMSGISKSQVSRLCGEIDDKVAAFLNRPLEGEWPYVWLDATYVKARCDGRIVAVAVIVAV